MNWTPRVGMKVRCKDSQGPGEGRLTLGRVYEVSRIDPFLSCLYVVDDARVITVWHTSRFEPVENYIGLAGPEYRESSPEDTYATLGAEIGRLVTEKQKAYGSSFYKSGDVLRSLYPDGVKPEQYDDMLAITRVLDKLYRIATDKDAFGESPWRDITGYGLLASAKAKK